MPIVYRATMAEEAVGLMTDAMLSLQDARAALKQAAL